MKDTKEINFVLVTRNVNTSRGHVAEGTPLAIGKPGAKGITEQDAATLLNMGKATPLSEEEYKKMTKGDKPEPESK